MTSVLKEKLSKLKEGFLAVGQRWDFENKMGEWQFTEQWETRYLENIEKKLHPPAGSDYFIFPRGQYKWGEIAPLVVGRPGWDNWMIYHARKTGYMAIDLSDCCLVYHQNHDYSHKSRNGENNLALERHNLAFLPEQAKYDFTLLACDRILSRNGELMRGYARGNNRAFVRIEVALGRSIFLSTLRFYRNRILSSQELLNASA